jgi:hypothetical protein
MLAGNGKAGISVPCVIQKHKAATSINQQMFNLARTSYVEQQQSKSKVT